MRQYLVRHGESVYNVESRVQGQADVSLSALGRLQADALAAWTRSLPPDVTIDEIWSSPLALWDDTFRKNPVAYTAASGLGEALREAGRLPEAERAIREAIRLSEGKRGDPWATLALILDAQGRTAEADEALDKAVEVDPKLADPEARVAALAMERSHADELLQLQERQAARR